MRRRLIFTTALIAFVAVLVLGVPLGIVESGRARNDALSRLEREADELVAVVDDRAERGGAFPVARIAPLVPAGRRAIVQTVDGRQATVGHPLAGSLLVTRSGAGRGTRVTLYASASEVTRRQRNVWLLVAALAVLGTLAAAGLAVLQARRFGRPLARLIDTSTRLGAGDFSARTGRLDLPEFDSVGAALDDAAVRIAGLVGRQREFSANVSHQLRTPLTALRLRVEELAVATDDAGRREEEAAALAMTDRLEATIADLLTLARAGVTSEAQDVDLAELAAEHVARWNGLFARAGRPLVLAAPRAVPVRVSPGGVAQAVDVLLENALVHGAGTTRLATTTAEGRPVLTVADDGEGVQEGLEDEVFARSVSTAGSSGIGLALARALVEADGGRLLLAQARPPRWEIRLPSR